MPATHFMVRVELRSESHSVAEADQAALDREMEAEGFSRLMTGSSGSVYVLPKGEYQISGERTRWDVLERAKRVASATERRFGILVTEGVAFLWLGLDAVPLGTPVNDTAPCL